MRWILGRGEMTTKGGMRWRLGRGEMSTEG